MINLLRTTYFVLETNRVISADDAALAVVNKTARGSSARSDGRRQSASAFVYDQSRHVNSAPCPADVSGDFAQ